MPSCMASTCATAACTTTQQIYFENNAALGLQQLGPILGRHAVSPCSRDWDLESGLRSASKSLPVQKPAGYLNRSVVDQNSAGR